MYVCSSAESTKTTLVIFGLSIGVQMAGKTDPLKKFQCQLGQGIRGMWGIAGSNLAFLANLLCFAATFLYVLHVLGPCEDKIMRHMTCPKVVCSQVFGLMPNALSSNNCL